MKEPNVHLVSAVECWILVGLDVPVLNANGPRDCQIPCTLQNGLIIAVPNLPKNRDTLKNKEKRERKKTTTGPREKRTNNNSEEHLFGFAKSFVLLVFSLFWFCLRCFCFFLLCNNKNNVLFVFSHIRRNTKNPRENKRPKVLVLFGFLEMCVLCFLVFPVFFGF